MHAKSLQSCLTLCDSMWTAAHQAPLSTGFSTREYWSGLRKTQSEKTTLRIGESISNTDKGLISKIHKQLMQLNKNKTKQNHPFKKQVEDLNGHFPKKTYRWPKSTWKDDQRNPIKTTMRYHCAPGRMATIKKSTKNKCWKGCQETGTLLHCWWGCKLVQSLCRTIWKFLKKLKLELPYDPAIPLLGAYL